MLRRTNLCRFCVVGGAVAASSFLCSLIGIELDYPKSPWFFVFLNAAGVAVLLVCLLDEVVLPRPTQDAIRLRLVAGALRGVIISVCVALAILFWTSVMIKTGDKFGGFACVLIGLATLYGPLAGAIVRGIGEWMRKRSRPE